MRVLVDTNIIIELLENRTQADLVDQVFSFCEQNHWNKYISVGSFYTITYLTERMLRRQQIYQPELAVRQRAILNDILSAFEMASTTEMTLRKGIDDKAFLDLEDSYQYQTAIANGCSILLTINTKDFSHNSQLKIMSPGEFIEAYNQQS